MEVIKFNISNSSPTINTSFLLQIEDITAIAMSNYLDVTLSDSSLLPFTITTSKTQIPYLKKEEMVLVVREKIDMSYIHSETGILPPGFIEIKK